MNMLINMSSLWWAVLIVTGVVCAAIGLATGSRPRHNGIAVVLLLSAVVLLTTGIMGYVL